MHHTDIWIRGKQYSQWMRLECTL